MDFNAVVTGDREVAARFAEFPKQLHDKLYERIERLTAKLYARVIELVPEGNDPNGLHLRNEIVSEMYEREDRIKGSVTLASRLPQSEYIKAGALEYGVHTVAKMKPSRREISKVFGRPVEPHEILIRAYPRTMDLEAQNYLRGALEDMEAEAVAEFSEALNEAIGE